MNSKKKDDLVKVTLIVLIPLGVLFGFTIYDDILEMFRPTLSSEVDSEAISAFYVSGPISGKTTDGFTVATGKVKNIDGANKYVPEERRIIIGSETKYEIASETGEIAVLDESLIWSYLKVGSVVNVKGDPDQIESYNINAKVITVLKVAN